MNETSKFLLAGVFVALVFFIFRPGRGSSFSIGSVSSTVGGAGTANANNLNYGSNYLQILSRLTRQTALLDGRARCAAAGGDLIFNGTTSGIDNYSCKSGANTLWSFALSQVE